MAISNEELTEIAYKISERFEKVNTFYLTKMAEQVKAIGKLDKDNMHRLQQMTIMGNNIDEINLYLSQQTGLALQDIYKHSSHYTLVIVDSGCNCIYCKVYYIPIRLTDNCCSCHI